MKPALTLRGTATFLLLVLHLQAAYSSKSKPDSQKFSEDEKGDEQNLNLEDFGLEYGRYLQQVVQALEQDEDFAKRLENMTSDQIKTGDVAKELEFVKHNVRSTLDELKRIELERLRSLAQKEMALKNEQNQDGRHWRTIPKTHFKEGVNAPKHVDSKNPYTFEADDLRKLIQATNKDLEELDRKRKEEFKRYELEKEYAYRASLANLTEEERQKMERKHAEMLEKHRKHPTVHHPGSKLQLEEVWEQQDRLPKEEFTPEVFFSMHDTNQDGFLDEQEVEAILSLEIKKLYDPAQNPEEDDPVEMMEEYNRMREHIYSEADKDKDRLISKDEFLDMTKQEEFTQDEGWKDLDDQTLFSETEFKEFEKEKLQARKGQDRERYDSSNKVQHEMPLPYQRMQQRT